MKAKAECGVVGFLDTTVRFAREIQQEWLYVNDKR